MLDSSSLAIPLKLNKSTYFISIVLIGFEKVLYLFIVFISFHNISLANP